MVVLFAGLAVGLVELDSHLGLEPEDHWPRFFGVSADGSRTLLSTVATAVASIAGVTFSITIVALSLAANQYTSRVLRNFMRDRSNQVVLGGLVSIFIYCLIVLRTVQGEDSQGDTFIPAVAVVVAILLGFAGMGLFIFFIHHVAMAIQVTSILKSVTTETLCAFRNLFPEDIGDEQEEITGTDAELKLLRDRRWEAIAASETGYIQTLDSESLMKFAAKHRVIVKVERHIGEYVIAGTSLFSTSGAGPMSPAQVKKLNKLVTVAAYRTLEQDPEYGVRLIVDIALKALSPSVNDPTTAGNCVDALSAVLHCLTHRRIPSPFRYGQGELRVIAFGPQFESIVDRMFHEIRQNIGQSVAIVIRLFNAIERAAQHPMIAARKRVLLKHVRLIAEQARNNIRFRKDLDDVEERLQQSIKALGQPTLL